MRNLLLVIILSFANAGDPIGSSGLDDVQKEINAIPFCYQYEYCDAIFKAANAHGVDPYIIMAILLQECRGKGATCPRGKSGEYGPMQVMPINFLPHERGKETNLYMNINAGTRYYANCLRLRKSMSGAFHCYNAGPRGINFEYVSQVTIYYNRVKRGNLNPDLGVK